MRISTNRATRMRTSHRRHHDGPGGPAPSLGLVEFLVNLRPVRGGIPSDRSGDGLIPYRESTVDVTTNHVDLSYPKDSSAAGQCSAAAGRAETDTADNRRIAMPAGDRHTDSRIVRHQRESGSCNLPAHHSTGCLCTVTRAFSGRVPDGPRAQ